MSDCLVCGEQTASFVDAGAVPLQCTDMYPDRESARSAAMGTMSLVICHRCSAVTNAAFDPELVPYGGDYENSQLFSGEFRNWATELAERLVGSYGLEGVPVVEVGSGKGEFLAMLARAGAGRATGYDPTYTGEIDHLEGLDVELVRTMFDGSSVSGKVGLVCSRHVLEHLAEPVEMLAGIRETVGADPGCALYVEVPNSAFTFTAAGLWDIIYQHCTYFSAAALEWAARSAGFSVISVEQTFKGQFLSLEATAGGQPGDTDGLAGQVGSTVESLEAFAPRYRSTLDQWRDRIAEWGGSGRRVALWGGGAKGVTFLNLVARDMDMVIDVNPRKVGRFLPGTGHEVSAPADLASAEIDVVVVMNAAYESEIRAEIASMGLGPEIALV